MNNRTIAELTIITNTKQLPWTPLRACRVMDEAEAARIADGRKAYLFKQTERAWYVFIELDLRPGVQSGGGP
jgi:hypothetical protein